MARPSKYTKEALLKAAIEVVRRDGEGALTARIIGNELGSSSRPLFTLYENMESLRADVRKEAVRLFSEYVADSLDYVPAFKEYGLRLVRFGVEEYNLFSMIFLSPELEMEDFGSPFAACRDAFVDEYGLTEEQAGKLVNTAWTFVCGLATLIHNGALHMSDEQISDALSEQFVGALSFIKSGRNVHGLAPKKRGNEDKITLEI